MSGERIHGRIIPNNTNISFEMKNGYAVPVVWGSGPVFCGYCKNFQSKSLQGIHKHIKEHHQNEIDKHEMRVRVCP